LAIRYLKAFDQKRVIRMMCVHCAREGFLSWPAHLRPLCFRPLADWPAPRPPRRSSLTRSLYAVLEIGMLSSHHLAPFPGVIS